MKASSHMPHKSDYLHQQSESQTSQKEKKGEKSPTFLDDHLDFTDAILMGLNSVDDAVLNGRNDNSNPFDFDK
jgi:hypothetical protein